MTHYIHHVPGRVRVKTPVLKRNEKAAAALGAALSGQDGILHHQVNTRTGSVVLHYDIARIEVQPILAFLARRGFLSPAATALPAPSRPRSRTGVGSTIGKAAFGFALEELIKWSATTMVKAIL